MMMDLLWAFRYSHLPPPAASPNADADAAWVELTLRLNGTEELGAYRWALGTSFACALADITGDNATCSLPAAYQWARGTRLEALLTNQLPLAPQRHFGGPKVRRSTRYSQRPSNGAASLIGSNLVQLFSCLVMIWIF